MTKVLSLFRLLVNFDSHSPSGHRLKSATTKTTKMFEHLTTKRRVILSGTPIQNDLKEFHAMVSDSFVVPIIRFHVTSYSQQVDFCNPGLLGEYDAME